MSFSLTLSFGTAVEGNTSNPGAAFGLVFDYVHGVYFDPSLELYRQTGAPFGSAQTVHSVATGALPPGVIICQAPPGGPIGFSPNQFGISGVPTSLGVFTGTFAASGAFGGDSFSITVVPVTYGGGTVCPVISLSALKNGHRGIPYSKAVVATGGVAPYTWDVPVGSLPTGLSLSAGGVLSGTPTVNGSYSFIIRATDVNGCPGVLSYTLVIAEPRRTQVRGSTQIKAGSIYDAQISDVANIARHKIAGLGDGAAPIFFPEEPSEDWMIIPGPPGAAGKPAAQVVPVFFPDDLFEEMPMGAGAGSSSAITAAVNASAYRATAQTLTHNTEAALSLSNTDYDTSSIWAGGNPTRMTCPSGGTGVYAVRSTVKFGTGFNGTLALRIYKNGALFTEETSAGLGLASGSEYHQVSADLQLVPTDYVEVKALVLLTAGSGTINTVGGSGNTFIQVALQSPQVGTAATPSGALILLESHAAAGGGSASLDFTARNATNQSGATFQSDFDDYVIEFVNILPATNGASLNMRMSTDGGATFDSGANYRYAYQFSNSAAGSGQSSSAAATSVFCAGTFTNTASAGSKGHIELANPLSASQTKLMLIRAAFLANDGNYYHLHGMGGYISTTAVNALRFLMSAGNIAAGTVRIYGMAK